MHGSAATPMHIGSETPMVGTPRGSNTPRGGNTPRSTTIDTDDAYDPWKISSAHDKNDAFDTNSEGGQNFRSALSGGNSSWDMVDNYSEISGFSGSNDNSLSSQISMTKLIGSEINHSDWQRNTVVQILPHKGTLGVLQGKVARDGTVDVMKMEEGRLVGAPMRFHYEAISPAIPLIDSSIEVVTGRYSGTIGTVKKIVGSDVFINEAARFVRLQHLLWKYKE